MFVGNEVGLELILPACTSDWCYQEVVTNFALRIGETYEVTVTASNQIKLVSRSEINIQNASHLLILPRFLRKSAKLTECMII